MDFGLSTLVKIWVQLHMPVSPTLLGEKTGGSLRLAVLPVQIKTIKVQVEGRQRTIEDT